MRPRIRTVKPEALKDEELWDLEASSGLPLYRAFQGLWMFADREGRFEWRPRALKSDILPYWDGDFARCLEALERGGFIQRYEVNGRIYGLVPSLSKHQRFDHREPQSILPPPPGRARADETDAVTVVAVCPGGREGKGREQEGKGEGSAPGCAQPQLNHEPTLTEPPAHTRVPKTWKPSEALYGEAIMAGVTREGLDEDVTYWRSRKLTGEFIDFDEFFRSHFPRLARHRETESAKATGIRRKDQPNQPNCGLTGLEIFDRQPKAQVTK